MTDFESLFDDEPQPSGPEVIEVEGVFQCNVCREEVEQALFSPSRQELFWYCPSKHENVIKGFNL